MTSTPKEGVLVTARHAEESGPISTALEKGSYGEILKSSALIGGASALAVVIGIIRTKVMALLLGPAGFGLMGMYSSILDLASGIAGMGVGSSGVRQIAESVGSGDTTRISHTVIVIRRLSIVLGLVGGALLVLASNQVSVVTFGSDDYVLGVLILSIAVFLRVVSAGQGALLQGMRRIGDLAAMNVLGTLFATIATIASVYYWGEAGIAPSLVAGAAVGLGISWWYSKQIRTSDTPVTARQAAQEAASLFKLGFAFMASGLLMMSAAYAARAMLLRTEGLDAAGLYQAAWTLGGLYVGFILQAMGSDFYPRLVGAVNDHRQCNRLVNEQAHVSLLLAGPGVIATLTFAPIVISLFYTAKFGAAVEVLRWICLGIALRVITWPMGFIIVAKNNRTVFLLAELAWAVVNVGLTWLCVRWFGLNGAGIAFFGSYVFHFALIYPIVRRLSGFRWSVDNVKLASFFVSSIALVFCGFHLMPATMAMAVGTLLTMLSGLWSLRRLVNLVHRDAIPRPILKLLKLGRVAR